MPKVRAVRAGQLITMKTIVDYAKSPAPKADAVNDVKDYFGTKWNEISAHMRQIKDVEQFELWANFAGVEGFPVKAWYDLYWGEGAYDAAWDVVADRATLALAQANGHA